MKAIFTSAISSVFKSWGLLVAVGGGGAAVSYGFLQPHLVPREFVVAASLLVAVGVIIALGRICSWLVSGRTTGSLEILRENGLNYLGAVIVIGLPLYVLRVFVVGQLMSGGWYQGFMTGLLVLADVLTVFVLPIVFLKRMSVRAIPTGVVFLLNNLSGSTWIAVFAALASGVQQAGRLAIVSGTPTRSFALFVSVGVVGALFSFVSYAAATQYLVGNTRRVSRNNASSKVIDEKGQGPTRV